MNYIRFLLWRLVNGYHKHMRYFYLWSIWDDEQRKELSFRMNPQVKEHYLRNAITWRRCKEINVPVENQ